jgi:xanthine/uracil/vitamin C permease (AzgA family)
MGYSWQVALAAVFVSGLVFFINSYPALKLLSGRPREASALVYFLGLLFVGRYLLL